VTRRRDIQLRGRVGIWSPPISAGLQVGLRYQPTRRFSTADLYDFTDHAVLLMLTFRRSGAPWLPRVGGEEAGRLALDYRLDVGNDILSERLQDLLRQDEEAQRGSSCMD